MSRDPRRAPASRCLLLWLTATAVAAGLLLVVRADLVATRHDVVAPEPVTFSSVLSAVASLALAVCVVWLWCVLTAATLEAAHGPQALDLPGLRGAVRRGVLAACGVALAASVAPANADDLHGVAGQPPQPLRGAAPTAVVSAEHVVAAGDSLWSISAERLGPGASDADVDRAWRAVWRANAAAVGDDPDLITPGQRLVVPEALR